MSLQSIEPPSLISMKEAERITSLSRTMINKLRRQGGFPEIVELGDRRVAFVRAEVVEWIQARIEGRANGRRFKSSGLEMTASGA